MTHPLLLQKEHWTLGTQGTRAPLPGFYPSATICWLCEHGQSTQPLCASVAPRHGVSQDSVGTPPGSLWAPTSTSHDPPTPLEAVSGPEEAPALSGSSGAGRRQDSEARGMFSTAFTGAWRRLKDSNVLAFWLPGQRARKHSGGVRW